MIDGSVNDLLTSQSGIMQLLKGNVSYEHLFTSYSHKISAITLLTSNDTRALTSDDTWSTWSIMPDDLNFRFHTDATFEPSFLLDLFDQRKHVGGGRTAIVDDKITVHVGNARGTHVRIL